jgi:hypothetical protein
MEFSMKPDSSRESETEKLSCVAECYNAYASIPIASAA